MLDAVSWATEGYLACNKFAAFILKSFVLRKLA